MPARCDGGSRVSEPDSSFVSATFFLSGGPAERRSAAEWHHRPARAAMVVAQNRPLGGNYIEEANDGDRDGASTTFARPARYRGHALRC
jgi:hypothetical protein